jgi:hypothetical protein
MISTEKIYLHFLCSTHILTLWPLLIPEFVKKYAVEYYLELLIFKLSFLCKIPSDLMYQQQG